MRTVRILVLVAVLSSGGVSVQANSLTRDRDPVVILGQDLGPLAGTSVGDIVAFRYQGSWQQIPVQIDERKYVDFGVVYGEAPVGIGVVAYADPGTYTGPDVDPAFDADDELVFMAVDAGDRAGAGMPAGVLSGSALELEIADPLDGGIGYVYLFQTDGSLTPDAGQDYVTYVFNLLAGDYIPNYNTLSGPNPEDSEAFSGNYRTRFSDRWIRDEVNVLAAGASGLDILDRHKNMFGPGDCVRTEDTFSNGEGAFFANKDGPVRAIRSYMGANSGPFTQRDHLFYAQRQDVSTFLRVHPISGVMDLYDYSPAASGMTYYNDLNALGVTVDGVPDVVTPGAILWEMVTGNQGTLIISLQLETDIPFFSYTSFYSDDVTPVFTQCTGDAFEYGTSGVWVDHSIPNTDPYLGVYNILIARRVVYYESPGQTITTAALRNEQARTPLDVTVRPYQPLAGDLDGDGDVDLSDFVTFAGCFSGAGVTTPPGGCEPNDFAGADLDDDSDVDLVDFLTFAGNFTG